MTIITEGRVFISQMMREARLREELGARLLSPGTHTWHEALDPFARRMSKAGSVVHAKQAVRCWPRAPNRGTQYAQRLLPELLCQPQA
jgi:hypothetical protein